MQARNNLAKARAAISAVLDKSSRCVRRCVHSRLKCRHAHSGRISSVLAARKRVACRGKTGCDRDCIGLHLVELERPSFAIATCERAADGAHLPCLHQRATVRAATTGGWEYAHAHGLSAL
jgi:hypothetical protein